MVSIRKVVGVVSCACLLSLGLFTVTQAAEKPLAAENMKSGLSDREDDHVKPDEETAQGTNTINGEVLRIKGEHVYVRQSDGKEMHLHTKPTTRMIGEFKKGDRIEAKVNDQNNVLSIRQVK